MTNPPNAMNRMKIDWQALQREALELLRTAEEDFAPEALITFSGPGAVVAHLAMVLRERFYPIYTVILEPLDSPFDFQPADCWTDETHKWRLHVPEAVLELREHRVLVLDDCRISGETAADLREIFGRQGFARDRLRFAVLATAREHLEGPSPPDYYRLAADGQVQMPWGEWF